MFLWTLANDYENYFTKKKNLIKTGNEYSIYYPIIIIYFLNTQNITNANHNTKVWSENPQTVAESFVDYI